MEDSQREGALKVERIERRGMFVGGMRRGMKEGENRSHCWRLRQRWHDDRRTISGEQRVGYPPPAYRKQRAGGNGRHPETPTSGYCLSYPVLPTSRSLCGTWRNLCVYTEFTDGYACAIRIYKCTYNETLYYISRTNNSGLEIGWRHRVAPKYLLIYLSPSSSLLSYHSDSVPSRLRVLDSVFAMALNGEENRSNVNARGTFATPILKYHGIYI